MIQPIGIFDSGTRGLGVLRALRAELPHEDFIYITDSGHAPHGERDEAYVVARSLAIAKYLVEQNIKALVVACNTASAATIDLLRATYPKLPIIGVEPALKPAAAISRTKHIGVMATRSTLASDKFKMLLQSQTGLATFTLQPCDGLAEAMEHSATTENATELIAVLTGFIGASGIFGNQKGQIDTVVLGCTHYAFAEHHLRKLFGPDVQLVATGEAVARQTQRQIAMNSSLLNTGKPQWLQAAVHAWLGLAQVPKLI